MIGVRLGKLVSGKHGAVAPIIATLLMVAIAVVGGVLIYTYTQGFFSGTQTTGTTTDIITMTGYDSRERVLATGGGDGNVNATGYVISRIGDYGTGDGKAVHEHTTLFLKNAGTKDTTITKFEVNGLTYTASTSTTAPTANPSSSTGANPVGGQYIILRNTAVYTTATGTTLPQGEEVTVIIGFASGSGATAGKTINVEVTTTGGNFAFHPVVGQRG